MTNLWIDAETQAPSRFFLGVAMGALFICLFLCNSNMPLWDDDEAAYAGFALQMLENKNWVNPDFNWAEIHRKTPFHFWSITVSYLIFGINEFAVRIPSALAVLLTTIALICWAKKIWGKAEAKWAGIIFSTSFLVVSMGKMSLTDAWLMLFETTAILALLNYLNSPHWRWNILFWVSISLGILVKGPPIIIVTGGIWMTLFIFHPKRRYLLHTHPWFYGLIALLPFVAWCYASYLDDGGQLLLFLYEWYIIKRIGGSVLGQTGPTGYHLVVALIAFLPWIPFLLQGFSLNFKTPTRSTKYIGLAAWLFFAWLFFELMSSKLPSYAMGAHPAFALLIATSVYHRLKKQNRLLPNWATYLFSILGIACAVGLYYSAKIIFPDSYTWIYCSVIPIAVLSVSYPFLKNQQQPIWHWAFSCIVLLSAWGWGINVLIKSPVMASVKIIETLKEQLPKEPSYHLGVSGFSNKQKRISFMFYLQKDETTVEELNDFEVVKILEEKTPYLILIGEEGWTSIAKTIETKKLKVDSGILPTWWSLNDQFKQHNFYWVRSPSISTTNSISSH